MEKGLKLTARGRQETEFDRKGVVKREMEPDEKIREETEQRGERQ